MAVLFAFACSTASAAQATAVSFNKQVAPILFKHCVKCHRPGEIASRVSLVDYDSSRPWAKAIKEKILKREMPPWPADPNGSVKFRNDATLSQKAIDTVVAWVDSGALRGNDPPLAPMPGLAQRWQHPKGLAPDVVITTPAEFEVPANGQISYVRYLAKLPFSDDRWIAALQVRPGNRAVVHHMAITEVTLQEGMKPADLDAMAQLARQMGLANSLPGSQPAVTDPTNPGALDMLGVYTPGTTFEMYGDDRGKLMKGGKNSYLNFNIHYQPSGKPEKDQSMIALWFRPGPPKYQLFRVPGATKTIIVNGREMLSDPGKRAEGTGAAIPPIPPYADNYEVIGITAYTEPITISQFQPHAHVRCKDFKYVVVYADGRAQTVLSVPKYSFQWQLAYELEEPLRLPAGSKLVVTAHYDNSRNNQNNPAPDKEVHFREGENQSWDEMFTPFVQYSRDGVDGLQEQDAVQTTNIKERGEPRVQNALDAVETAGCLQQSSGKWVLASATGTVVSDSQSTSSVALKSAQIRSLGNQTYHLLGLDVFNPSSHNGQKVVVKGVLIKSNASINVTSLQTVSTTCGR